MHKTHPNSNPDLKFALKRFHKEACVALCQKFPRDEQGRFLDGKAVFAHLQSMMPGNERGSIIKIFASIATVAQATKDVSTNERSREHLRTQPITALTQPHSTVASPSLTGNQHVSQATIQKRAPDFRSFARLLVDQRKDAAGCMNTSSIERSIRQAPLLTEDIITTHYQDLVPQFGLLGSLEDGRSDTLNSQLSLNTNVPFSAFICGVQGSGKSHTTSCILENAILRSPNIGHLESPVSSLVFSYGEWSNGGAGFDISEATFLGASHADFPDHHAKKITVLYSPSNAAIKKLYERFPNVEMIPFRLKAETLDIGTLHTLMAVNEKSTMPLYMATVEAILRKIASKSVSGTLNYLEFKRRLAAERFDPVQTTMLKMRMNLLESFLDLDGTASEPDFSPGEITIIDLSDPFLTTSTACILFKLALERFLQSSYMLDTSGSKILTDYLTKVIRLQRHQGARVVISTQEPTIATDLIALCSITIMHRFTSPTWYDALRKHINVVDGGNGVMQQIESLDTGEALVYSPSVVLAQNDDGSLVKAVGRLMKVRVRKRVTLDGGASVMAV
ncbi:hypothetical protein C7974DRAFT_409894 [Boeremia exigua]|uniref:uncharacterized protein n=1 Tax=Boeremia exigua TaxID=749465 RepID=UPI001E8CF19A|nr:uncharacterized protein C7974DRAFT_409894 [Boeremia exigua]KAH6638893.1 hypothetical protein C7974DRAFT_409894 [Boeremia exigua]